VLAERECRLEPLLERIDAQRLEPPRLGAKPLGLGEPLQGSTAPERERECDALRSTSCIALAQCAACLCEQILELDGVDARLPQGVSIGRSDDRVLSEGSAQPRDVMLDGVARGGR
jgi:hypothetical protein